MNLFGKKQGSDINTKKAEVTGALTNKVATNKIDTEGREGLIDTLTNKVRRLEDNNYELKKSNEELQRKYNELSKEFIFISGVNSREQYIYHQPIKDLYEIASDIVQQYINYIGNLKTDKTDLTNPYYVSVYESTWQLANHRTFSGLDHIAFEIKNIEERNLTSDITMKKIFQKEENQISEINVNEYNNRLYEHIRREIISSQIKVLYMNLERFYALQYIQAPPNQEKYDETYNALKKLHKRLDDTLLIFNLKSLPGLGIFYDLREDKDNIKKYILPFLSIKLKTKYPLSQLKEDVEYILNIREWAFIDIKNPRDLFAGQSTIKVDIASLA